MSHLSAFSDKPKNIKFRDQEENEVIEMFLRQHPIVNLPWILISVFFIFVLPGFITGLNASFGIITIPIPYNLSLTFWVIWLLVVFSYMIERFLHWYFNVYIITNIHLVDINFYSLLNSQTTEVEIRDVESTQVSMRGVFSSFFNYGDVIIQTAAETQQVTFKKVPLPYRVADKVADLSEIGVGNGQ